MEPFRWLGDVATLEAFESGVLDLKDFYFTGDDYRYHIEIEAKRRFLELLKSRFNSGVKYKGKTWKWDMVILGKTQELARYFVDKPDSLDFVNPSPKLERNDRRELREQILGLAVREAARLDIGRSSLHDMWKRVNTPRPFKVYRKTLNKLENPKVI